LRDFVRIAHRKNVLERANYKNSGAESNTHIEKILCRRAAILFRRLILPGRRRKLLPCMTSPASNRPVPPRRRIPRSFKDLTPAKHFNPRTFFQELVWKGWFTPRHGESRRPVFPRLKHGQVALTWIGHASFLIQFKDLNVLVDPNFANWLFLLKRIKRAGLKIRDLPRIDLILLTHAHFDHFHKPTLRKLPEPKIGVMPWGVGDLAKNLGFARIVELDWWESFSQKDWKVTFTPSQHWGARTLHDHHRGYGGFVLEHQGRKIYHCGDSAYFDGFAEIGKKLAPEIALLPIGAYHPESFRKVHMGPDEAVRAFRDLRAKVFVPMHYGTFKLSFEAMDEPLRWLREIATQQNLVKRLKILDEGLPKVF
jgi:L-ascorbate metabolism protein UlaG (beta-lactamase superfamily)